MFRTRSGRSKGSRWAATHAGPITRAVDAIACRSLERGLVLRALATGLLRAAGISSRGGLLEQACAVAPWLARVPAVAERLQGKHRAENPSVLFVKKIGQWELPKTSQIFWTESGWSVHSSEETLFLNNMSAPITIAPFYSRFITSARRTWASSSDSLRGGLRANWSV